LIEIAVQRKRHDLLGLQVSCNIGAIDLGVAENEG